MEENIFYIEEQNSSRPPGNGNNCNGHSNSIQAGGNGHWVGDSCGCDGIAPSVSINAWIPILLLVALIVIIKVKNRIK